MVASSMTMAESVTRLRDIMISSLLLNTPGLLNIDALLTASPEGTVGDSQGCEDPSSPRGRR